MLRTEMNQTDFAAQIGMPYRTYQTRITGSKEWKLSEIIKLCEIAASLGEELSITVGENTYSVNVKVL